MMDWEAPSTSWPAFCLAAADQALDVANWPDLVPYLRAVPLRYDPTGSNQTTFTVTNYSITSNVVRLTLSGTGAERMLECLLEDKLVQGSWPHRTVTLNQAIGAVPAGDYALTGIDTTSYWLEFSYTTSNDSGAVTKDVSFFRHRIAGSSTTAQHYAVRGRGFVTVNDADSEWIGGLRRRDRGQGHRHDIHFGGNAGIRVEGVAAGGGTGAWINSTPDQLFIHDPTDDGANGVPRTGKTTDIRGLALFPYVWGKSYVAP